MADIVHGGPDAQRNSLPSAVRSRHRLDTYWTRYRRPLTPKTAFPQVRGHIWLAPATDAPFLLSHLQQELTSAVVVKENSELLATFNVTSGVLTGTSTKAAALDLLADAIAAQEAVNGILPSAVIMNPADLAVVRKAKASTGGEYFLDPLASTPPSVHGVRLVSSAVVASGTSWIVNAAGVVIYRRGPITVDIGYNADDWQTNQRTMRVEERFQTAVVRPSMLTKLTLT